MSELEIINAIESARNSNKKEIPINFIPNKSIINVILNNGCDLDIMKDTDTMKISLKIVVNKNKKRGKREFFINGTSRDPKNIETQLEFMYIKNEGEER